jgi:5-methylcytosine-specific restriction endonuclease McrA
VKSLSKGQLKRLRIRFREAVLERDDNVCRVCGGPPPLDAHHIISRKKMPADGYSIENGIALCKDCHWKAEEWIHKGGSKQQEPGYSTQELFEAIGLSEEGARAACRRLL